MLQRIFLYRAMVLAPAMLFVGVCVESRIYDDGFVPVTMSADQMARVEAYTPLVEQTDALLSQRSAPKAESLLKVAQAWVAADDNGQLKPLAPIAFDDSSHEGVKETIFEAKASLAHRLIRLAQTNTRTSPRVACEALTLALRVSEIAKFSDFESVESAVIEQRTTLRNLRSITLTLDQGQRNLVASELDRVERDQHPLAAIASLARYQYLDWCARNGRKALDIDSPKQTAGLNEHQALLASSDGQLPNIVSIGEDAERLQSNLLSELHQVQRELKEAGPSNSVVLRDVEGVAALNLNRKSAIR